MKIGASSAVYGYIASKQTHGSLATDNDREMAMSYQEKAQKAKEEENNLIKNITNQLRGLYSSMINGSSTDYKKLNIIRTYLHYKFGNGQPMYVDITGMHIPTISAKRDFNDEVGKIKSINTFSISKLSTIGITVGSARFRYAGNNKVEILGDKYDFDLRKGASLERNIATLIGGIIHDVPILPSSIMSNLTTGGTDYDIIFKGLATVNP